MVHDFLSKVLIFSVLVYTLLICWILIKSIQVFPAINMSDESFWKEIMGDYKNAYKELLLVTLVIFQLMAFLGGIFATKYLFNVNMNLLFYMLVFTGSYFSSNRLAPKLQPRWMLHAGLIIIFIGRIVLKQT